MKARIRFAAYIVMAMLLTIDLSHFTTAMKFMTCLTFTVIMFIENIDRAQTNETLGRLGLEIREGKLKFEHSTREINLYDLITLKKEK